MKKVLIISYFYPPCNLTASQRPYSWAKHLHEHGYYPIVITRKWNQEIATYVDMARDSGTDDRHEINSTHEVWYLRFRGNLRDRLFARYGNEKMVLLRRALSLAELFLQNFFIAPVGYSNIYCKARGILKENPDIRKMVISANPYVQFHFAYLLKKEFPDLKWIADYRDDWTTSGIFTERNVIKKLLYLLEEKSEKRWVSTASCITSVSAHYANKISSLVHLPGFELPNGFSDDVEQEVFALPDPGKFIITYTGTLYEKQPIEVFLNAFIILSAKFSKRIKLVFQCIGLGIDPVQEKKVRNLLTGFDEDVIITNRIPRQQALGFERKSNLLLLLGQNVPGNIASKLYEYIALRKKIIFIENEDADMAYPLNQTGLAITCNSTEDIIVGVSVEIEKFLRDPRFYLHGDASVIQKFSRKNQVKILTDILDKL